MGGGFWWDDWVIIFTAVCTYPPPTLSDYLKSQVLIVPLSALCYIASIHRLGKDIWAIPLEDIMIFFHVGHSPFAFELVKLICLIAILLRRDTLRSSHATHKSLNPIFLSADLPWNYPSSGNLVPNRCLRPHGHNFRMRERLSMHTNQSFLEAMGWRARQMH